jgi:hypothetical protein
MRWIVVAWIVTTVAFMGFIDNQRIAFQASNAHCGKYKTT